MTNWAQRQREIERARAQAAREYQRQVREQERYLRQQQRERAFEEKERRRLYVEGRVAEADELNEDLATTVAGLRGILAATLGIDDHIDFESLKERPRPRELELGALAFPAPSPEYTEPPAPTGLRSLVPGAKAKHAQAVDEARRAHAAAMADWERHEERRVTQVRERQEQHEAATNDLLEQAHVHNEAVDRFKAAFDNYEPDAVVNYFSLVLAASGYPEGFPKQYKVAFVPESKQLVVEYDLPDFTVVPEVREYHYVKAKDEIAERTRPMTERKALYAGLVAQTALRTIHELFEADRGRFVETVVYNGYVDSIDRRTGHAARPCLVTVRTSRDAFGMLDLARVEPQECLKGLNASVSRSPAELTPVRPVLEFNMVDSRFVEETDVLASLDERPNLMELTPSEFESLITNLFEKMGLETRLTQPSRDGGVDCVAYDARPILGGKVVIQAKRYKRTVGVSAVRDLFGTMQNEGASKGILVTTSGYGKASFDFAAGKPLELLSGTELLYLLEENADIKAKIEPPEDWVDPVPSLEDPSEPVAAQRPAHG